MTRVGVIGLGNMGKHHARNYADMIGVELVAVCDVSQDLAEATARKFSCRAYCTYQEMLARERLDAVSVVVPTKLHKEVAVACMSRGIHVLVEKPIAGTIADGEAIISAAKQYGVLLQIGHIERFNPAVQRLKQIMDDGKLGEVTSIIARRVGAVPVQVRDANVVVDLAVHDIDVINYLYGVEADSIMGNVGKAMIEKREDYAEIFLKYGLRSGFVQVNWITPIKIRNLSVTGSKGYAELNYITQELVVYESNYTKEVVDEYGDYVITFGIPNKTHIGIEVREPMFLELQSFLKCVKTGETPLVTGEIGLQVLRIALEVMGQSRIK